MAGKTRPTVEVESCSAMIREILKESSLAPGEFARYLGTSRVSVVRWARGDMQPPPRVRDKLAEVLGRLKGGQSFSAREARLPYVFASRGAPRVALPLFEAARVVEFNAVPKPPILTRLCIANFWGNNLNETAKILADHEAAAPTLKEAAAEGVSAGKNTYTYDAHTYHTKVPPQGIAEVIKKYLPSGGLVLDPFAGSGMTGVAALAAGADVILNELSPAASFIADRFTRKCDPAMFAAGVQAVCDALSDLRRELYTTRCRTCGRDTEILFTVWSYRVRCSDCDHEFLLWDQCRSYGRTVREHKIISEFRCPSCATPLKKARLRRTTSQPVLLGYKCCSRLQTEHSLTKDDLERLARITAAPPLAEGFVPNTELPDGVNLSQPKRHGLTSIDRFYTSRNLAAMSQLWREIHLVKDDELAAFLAFAFTSLYQRVTRLSEFRFWGGSGNTANFNVPYIFNEANVFVTFQRKARAIQDHLETTARSYSGRVIIRTGSATDLSFLPDNSVDLVFTDPPFGANINYSEMNILWESWLGAFTDSEREAIVNRFQNKDVASYGRLMTACLRETHRVLRPGHWMVLAFMNSSEQVWGALRDAVLDAGFSLECAHIFDKQHGTFKQFVSDNTAGCDLLLHCRKAETPPQHASAPEIGSAAEAVRVFLRNRQGEVPKLPYLHVQRRDEIDYRMLYSEFLADRLIDRAYLTDFATFRAVASSLLDMQQEPGRRQRCRH